MNIVWKGYVLGMFYGYKPGRLYQLSNGTYWRQDDMTDEPVFSDEPEARLMISPDGNRIYLDVSGTVALVHVSRADD